MKLNSTQIRSATLLALLAGLSPALIAQTSTADNVAGETDRNARAEDRLDGQRPGHNSNRVAGQPYSATTSTTADSVANETDRNARAEDRLDGQRPGHNSSRVVSQPSSSTYSTTPGATPTDPVPGQMDPDPRAINRPGQAAVISKDANGSAAAGVVYTPDHAGRRDLNEAHQHPNAAAGATLRKGSANELTGMAVKSRTGESLGNIKDFVIDTQSGQVVYAIVGSGGIAGIGEKLHAVPVQALSHNVTGDRESLTLDVDSARWSQAPRFSKDRIATLRQDDQGRVIHDYYGQTWRTPGQRVSMNNPVRNQGNQEVTTQSQQKQVTTVRGDARGSSLALASDLIGKNIRNGDQAIGEIDDVIVQLDSGSAAALLDPDNDFAGSDQKYVVPLSRFTFSENRALSASLQRSDFSSARAVDSGSWASAQSDSLYVWQADRMGERRTDSAFADQKGTPPVAEIRRAIQADSSLAANQNDIRIDARGDKLVLSGTVLNEDTKDKIEDRAEKAAPGWDIDNQLRVATTMEE